MAEQERIVTVRGEGGHVFEIDLAKNPWAEKQLAAKRLKMIAGPTAELGEPEKPKRGGKAKPKEPQPEKAQGAAEEPAVDSEQVGAGSEQEG